LEEFETVLYFVVFLLSKSAEFGHLLANVVAYTEFAFTSNNFIVLLIFQLLFTKWVIANNLSAGLFVSFDFNQRNYFGTKRALNVERVDYLFNHT
jgi:hypothetical protein